MTIDGHDESPGSKPALHRNIATRIAYRLGILSATSALVTLVLAWVWANTSSELQFLESVITGTLVCAFLSGTGAILAGFTGAIHDVFRGRGGGRRLGCFIVTILLVALALWAAVVIPSTFQSRQGANESGAAGSVRTISSAVVAYTADQPDGASFRCPTLGQLVDAGLLPEEFRDGLHRDYRFTLEPVERENGVPGYNLLCLPVTPGESGVKTYFCDESGVIRFETDGSTPSSASPPLS